VGELSSKIDKQKKEVFISTPKTQKPQKKEEGTDKKCEEEQSTKKEENVQKPRKEKRKNSPQTIAWIGTSISKALDRNTFENDTNVKLKFVKAYGIKEETAVSYPKDPFRFPDTNFKKIVPEVLEEADVDTLVMETGSIEITNIKVNDAMMDTTKDIEEYKKEWFTAQLKKTK
jgi:hypothetical protein